MNTIEDKLAGAKSQGQAQFDSIKEMVEELQRFRQDDAGGMESSVEDAERRIHEDALSVEVRGDWHSPGEIGDACSEYRILLCTGGPAVQIVGKLSEHGEPETAQMQVQDWFQPWTDFTPSTGMARGDGPTAEAVMLDYARCFYFGG